jgi:hypothetical protein
MLARAAFIFAGTLLLGAAMATLFLLYHEPTYKGRRLEHWIKVNSRSPDDPAAREAIVFITTNSAPELVRWLSADVNPRWTLRSKLPPFLLRNQFVRRLVSRENNLRRAALATRAFEVAGTNASPAIAALDELLSDRQPFSIQAQGFYILRFIGPAALPQLRHAMSNYDPNIRLAAVDGIKRLGTTATVATPDLIAALSDTDTWVRQNATQALEVIAPNALTNSPPR